MPLNETPALSETQMHSLKQEAALYFSKNGVPEKLEEILNSMFYEKPEDVYGRLSKYFETMAIPARISHLQAMQIIDSTGNPALSCHVHCTYKNESKMFASTYMSLFPELSISPKTVDADEKEITNESLIHSCLNLVHNVLSTKLKEKYVTNQREIDCALRKWIDDEERGSRNSSRQSGQFEDEDDPHTPTPSSGRKKRAPSLKGKGKASDKPVPPYEPPEQRLQGGSAVALTSVAVLKAASTFLEQPIFQHLHTVMNYGGNITLPVPAINLISGGKATPGKLNMGKNVFVIAKPGLSMEESLGKLTQVFHQIGKNLMSKVITSKHKPETAKKIPALLSTGQSGGYQPVFEKIEQTLDLIQEAVTAVGMTSGQDVFIGIDCAAHDLFDYDKGKYEIMTGGLKSADEIVEYYRDIVNRYPSIIALIDPLRKEDREQWAKICEILSEKCFLLGSDAVYGSMHAVTLSRLEDRPTSGLVFSCGGRVTVTNIVETAKIVRENGGMSMFVSPAGDVCDTVFSDLGGHWIHFDVISAAGLNIDIVRFGAPSRGENTERINRLIEIEQYIKKNEIGYNLREKFNFPIIKPAPPPAEEDVISNMTSSSPDQKSKKK